MGQPGGAHGTATLWWQPVVPVPVRRRLRETGETLMASPPSGGRLGNVSKLIRVRAVTCLFSRRLPENSGARRLRSTSLALRE